MGRVSLCYTPVSRSGSSTAVGRAQRPKHLTAAERAHLEDDGKFLRMYRHHTERSRGPGSSGEEENDRPAAAAPLSGGPGSPAGALVVPREDEDPESVEGGTGPDTPTGVGNESSAVDETAAFHQPQESADGEGGGESADVDSDGSAESWASAGDPYDSDQ